MAALVGEMAFDQSAALMMASSKVMSGMGIEFPAARQILRVVCGDGFTFEDGACVEYTPSYDYKCLEGFELNAENKCVKKVTCEKDYYWNGEVCVKATVDEYTKVCPEGYTMNASGECVKEVTCEDGFTWNGEECVEFTPTFTSNLVCEEGYTMDADGNCVKEVTCDDGYTFDGEECVEYTIDVKCKE